MHAETLRPLGRISRPTARSELARLVETMDGISMLIPAAPVGTAGLPAEAWNGTPSRLPGHRRVLGEGKDAVDILLYLLHIPSPRMGPPHERLELLVGHLRCSPGRLTHDGLHVRKEWLGLEVCPRDLRRSLLSRLPCGLLRLPRDLLRLPRCSRRCLPLRPPGLVP